MSAPIAPKAQAAGVTAAVSGAALYLLGKYVFKGSVPDGVASMVYIAVPGLLTLLAAYLAPHQVRPGDAGAVAAVAAGRMEPSASVSLTGAQMDAVRDALEHEQTAADERKVPPG